jgi:multidrug efflux system membrane fusion protein
MIRAALLLLTALSAAGLWYVLAGAEGQASAQISVAKLPAEPSQAVQTSFPQKGAPPIAVTTVPVRVKAVPITRTSIGWIEPTARVTVRTRIDGTIVERRIHDGAEVGAGDLLFRLDDRELQAQIARGEAALARDRAVLAKVEASLRRTQELLSRSVATQAQTEEAAAEVRIAAANVAASEAALTMDRTRLAHTRITAPISGRAGVVYGSEGHVVRGSDLSGDGLVTITQMSRLQVSFSLPERDLPLLRATLSHPEDKSRVRVITGPNGQTSSVDVSSGTILAKAVLKTNEVWPGQYVRVELTLGKHPEAAAVPLVALQMGHGGSHVFIVRPDDIAEMRRVQALAINQYEAIVTEGLSPGERVVVEGLARLRDGSPIVEAAAAEIPLAQGSRTADARSVRP